MSVEKISHDKLSSRRKTTLHIIIFSFFFLSAIFFLAIFFLDLEQVRKNVRGIIIA